MKNEQITDYFYHSSLVLYKDQKKFILTKQN